MSSIPFKIMLHGLIALAPSVNSNDPNHITALLFDGRPPSTIECLGEHHPKLTFLVSPGDQEECSTAGCEVSVDTCECTESLAGKKIWLVISPQAGLASQKLPSDGDEALANNHGVPANKAAAGSLLYVANMTKPPFNMEIDPDYLAPQPRAQNLLARMEVPFSTLTACSLSNREDQGTAHVQPMSFRKLGRTGKNEDQSQALAQMVLAKFDIDVTQNATIHMSDFSGANEHSILVAPHPVHGYMVNLSNETDKLDPGAPCDDGIARHFALFYEFAKNPPAWADRLLPHVRFSSSTIAESVNPDICKDPTLNFMDRPICPIASFF